MVFEGEQPRFDQLLDRLEVEELVAFKNEVLQKSAVLDRLTAWRDALFDDAADRPGGDLTDQLLDLARHMAQHDGQRPVFFRFEDRQKNDLDAIAHEHIDRDLGPRAVTQALQVEYARRDRLWRTFYHNYDRFKSHYDACVNRMMHAERHGADPRRHQPTLRTPQHYPEMEPSDETKREVKVRDNYCCCCCCWNDNARLLGDRSRHAEVPAR